MATRALIMAGGRGERMKASGHPRPKPLVDAAGATLLERNVFRLLACGIDDVIVAVGADATDIAAFADDRVPTSDSSRLSRSETWELPPRFATQRHCSWSTPTTSPHWRSMRC